MADNTRRSRVGERERGTPHPEWEVFVREHATEPLHHVGSVAAPTADEAYDRATELFGWYATDLWLCPAAHVERYTSRPLTESTSESESDGSSDDGGTDLTTTNESPADTPDPSSQVTDS